MAERIKINVGKLKLTGAERMMIREDYIVHGSNCKATALPREVPVCYQEVAHCLEKSISVENVS